MAQEQALRLHDLLGAAAALGVVQCDHKVRGGSSIQTARDGGPGRQQVGQRDGAEVMRQGRTDQRRAGVDGGGTWDDLDFDAIRHHAADAAIFRFFLGHFGRRPAGLEQHLERRPGHAVHARIAGRHQRHLLALACTLQCLDGAVQFLGHALADDLLAADQVGDQLDVGDVADDGVGFLDRFACACRHGAGVAGSDADQHDLAVAGGGGSGGCSHGVP